MFILTSYNQRPMPVNIPLIINILQCVYFYLIFFKKYNFVNLKERMNDFNPGAHRERRQPGLRTLFGFVVGGDGLTDGLIAGGETSSEVPCQTLSL